MQASAQKSWTAYQKASATPRRSPAWQRRSCRWSGRMGSKVSSRGERAVRTVPAARATGLSGGRIAGRSS
jgi:hypothetical protein